MSLAEITIKLKLTLFNELLCEGKISLVCRQSLSMRPASTVSVKTPTTH